MLRVAVRAGQRGEPLPPLLDAIVQDGDDQKRRVGDSRADRPRAASDRASRPRSAAMKRRDAGHGEQQPQRRQPSRSAALGVGHPLEV